MKAPDGFKTTNRTINIEGIHSNITPEILEITIDKLKIVLLENDRRISDSNQWQAPLGIFITILLVLVTADFRQAFWLSAAVWHAIFIISAVFSFIWLLISFNKVKERITVDALIEKMKDKI